MRKTYPTKIEMIKDLSEKANVDYEQTLKARHNSFFTKDGVGYAAPVFPIMVKLLNEHANANLKEDECFSLPRGFILTFNEVEVKPVKEPVIEKIEEKQPEQIEPEEKQEVEKPKPAARKASR